MVRRQPRVESCAKIAMTLLRRSSATMGLLPRAKLQRRNYFTSEAIADFLCSRRVAKPDKPPREK
jgi:hypothetical protein